MRPELILAVRIEVFQAASLSVVANGAAKVGELVAALPAPVRFHVAQRGGVRVRAQRLRVPLEARVVAGDVAGLAAIHVRVAELRHDDLLDARLVRVDRLPLGVRLRQAARLLEIGGLVFLPAA